jgi:hypothetical protein
MARAWVELMKRLGYSRFAAQGGDWGAFVTNAMAHRSDCPHGDELPVGRPLARRRTAP